MAIRNLAIAACCVLAFGTVTSSPALAESLVPKIKSWSECKAKWDQSPASKQCSAYVHGHSIYHCKIEAYNCNYIHKGVHYNNFSTTAVVEYNALHLVNNCGRSNTFC